MTSSIRKLAPIFAVSLATGVGGCSGCSEDGALKKFPTITIMSPSDGFQLTRANDTDGDFTNGLQMEIVVRTTALNVGERVKLTAVNRNDATLKAEATADLVAVAGEDDTAEARFTGFTPPVGQVTLTASYSFSESAKIEKSIGIRVEAINLPTLSIISPQDSARLTAEDDNDGDLFNGFTTTVTVAAQNVQEGQTVELKVNDVVVGQAQLSASGGATFSDISLPEAPEPPGVSISASTTNTAGDEASATIRVLVDTGRCIVRLTPQPSGEGACDYVTGDDEAPDDSTWVERTFTVESNCDTVALTVNGVQQGEAKEVVDGQVTFLVPLEQVDGVEGQYEPRPSNELRVTASAEDGRFGSTPPVSFSADTIAPTLTVQAPQGNGPDGALIRIDDRDPDEPGLQFNMQGTICAAAADATVSVALTDAEGEAVGEAVTAAVQPELVDGCRQWNVLSHTLLEPGTLTITASSTDACGNAGQGVAEFTANFVVPTLTVTAPADGAVLALADDLDNDVDNGLQTVATVESTDVPAGDTIRIQRSDVPADGADPVWQAIGGAEGIAPEGDDPKSTNINLTLPAGEHLLRARYAGANPANLDSIRVSVVLTTPTIAFAELPARTAANAISACVTTANVPVGAEATLVLNGQDHPQTAAITEDGGACFEDVPLVEGDNTLSARVSDQAAQEATADEATVVQDQTAPQVAFTRPGPNDLQLDDNDDADGNLANGFQYDIRVAVIDGDPTVAVELTAQGVTYDEPAQDANGFLFEDVALGPGDNVVSASATDSVGNTTAAQITINVDIDAPQVSFESPQDGDCYADGADVTVVLTTDAGDGSEAFVSVGGQDSLPRPVAGGRAEFNLFLPADQDSTLRGRVEAGVGAPGFTAPITVTVKTQATELTFNDPAADSTLNGAVADDGPGVAGFQQDIVVDATELSPNQTATLSVDCGGGAQEHGPVAAVNGAFTFNDVTLVDGACVTTVDTEDCAGTAAQVQTTITVDRTPPAISLGLDDGERVDFTADLNPVLDGVQTNLQCTANGAAPGSDVCLTVAVAPDPAGDPVCRVTDDGEGGVVFSSFTLPDGEAVTVTCTATDAAGNSGSDSAVVEVVAAEPTLTFVSPEGSTNWTAGHDTDAAEGFQGFFQLRSSHVPDGTDARLCSDQHGGQGEVCTENGFRAIATTQADSDFITFPGVEMAQGEHSVYTEVVMAEFPRTDTLTITVDSVRPQVLSVDPTCDGDDDGDVNAADDEDGDAAGMQCSISVGFAANENGIENGRTVELVSDHPAPGTLLGSGAVDNSQVTISVTLAQGLHESIYARASDAAGNAALGPGSNALNQGGPLLVDTVAPTVTIADPAEGASLLVADDLDLNDADNELQYTVRVNAAGAASLAITNPGGDDHAVDNPVGTTARQVDLVLGANTITATATDAVGNSAQTSVNVTADPIAPTLTIQAPAADANLTADDDVDVARGGFQVDVVLATTDLAEGASVTVRSDGNVVSDPATVAADGSVTARCSLPPGAQTLTAHATDASGNPGISAGVAVDVEVVGCGLSFTTPAASPHFVNIANDADGDAGNGGQLDFQAVSLNPACAALNADLLVDGEVHAQVASVEGVALFEDVTLAEGNYSVDVRIDLDGDPSLAGARTITVDLTAPTVAFTAPGQDPSNLAVAQDLDQGTDGLQYNFGFTVTGAEGGTLTLSSDAGGQLASKANLTAVAAQTINNVTVADGAHNLSAVVTDTAGNSSEAATLAATIDTVAPGAPGNFGATLTNRRQLGVRLDFEASGDDGAAGGAVASYEVRYSTAAIDADNFDDACVADVNVVPAAPGEAQQVTVEGPGPNGGCAFRSGLPDSGGSFHLAVRATDDLGNVSALGTTAEAVTARWREHSIPAPDGVDSWGERASPVGDINNDGHSDFVIGSATDGKAWLIYGAAVADLGDIVPQDVTPNDAGGLFGLDVVGVGDVTGDGISDLLVNDGATAFLFAGVNGGQVDPTPIMRFAADGDLGGFFLGAYGAGNFNGDDDNGNALNDFVIASPFESGSGVAYLVQGRANWPGGTITLGDDADDNTANGVTRIIGKAAGDAFGLAGAPLTDRDGDGFDEVVITARAGNSGVGEAYLFSGRADLPAVLTTGSGDVTTIASPNPGVIANFGGAVNAGADFTGDGVDDIVIAHTLSRSILLFSGADLAHVDRVDRDLNLFGFPVWLVDLTGDGTAEILAASHPDDTGEALLMYRHDGVFQDPLQIFEGPVRYGRAVAPATDFTGNDGLADFMIGSAGGAEVLVYY